MAAFAKAKHAAEGRGKKVDVSLLIKSVRQNILDNQDMDRCSLIFKQDRLWLEMEPDQQLAWAGLAQMGGSLDVAERILAHINQTRPDMMQAWEDRLYLLSFLNNNREMARVLALAKNYIKEKDWRRWGALVQSGITKGAEEDVQAAAGPFETLRKKENAAMRFMDLFRGREDCFARQWADKKEDRQGYVPVRRALNREDIEDHFRGLKTYGIYLLQADSNIKTAVIDIDLRRNYRGRALKADVRNRISRERTWLLTRIRELSDTAGFSPLVEFSGSKGYHIWYFFKEPTAPGRIRPILQRITDEVAPDLSAFGLEVFPKQDHLKGKGFGNLVKLPLGVHRLSGKKSYFLECPERSNQAQLAFLQTARYSDLSRIEMADKQEQKKKVFVHPRFRQWAGDYPELNALQGKCPPLGQIIAACFSRAALSVREEKIILQTIGFLPRRKTLLHYLFSQTSEYNPHLVDFKISRLRGTPLGCNRIHTLMGFAGDFCRFDKKYHYPHPLLHLDQWQPDMHCPSGKIENLKAAMENLHLAVDMIQRFVSRKVGG